MLFRVWDKENKKWLKDVNITDDGCAFTLNTINYSEYTKLEQDWLLHIETDVEFNTGITLADGTETFFGDIVRWKVSMFDNRGGDGYRYWVLEPKKLRLPWVWRDIVDKNCFIKDVELVGNIHKTELMGVLWNKN